MSLLFLSFLAGILTVLAPCSFMLLPIIIGGSATNNNRWRPYIITASLSLSLFLVTLVLKVSSSLVNIDPVSISYFSGVIIIFLGLVSLFPQIWTRIQVKLGLSKASDDLLTKASEKEGIVGAILTGADLGPVFSSCSPTFVFLLTTVIRQDFAAALANMIAYIIGLAMIMLLVSLFGQKFTRKLGFAVNPDGIFKKVIAIVFIIVGIAIITGLDKSIQRQFGQLPFVGQLEQGLLSDITGVSNQRGEGILNAESIPAPEITGIDQWINTEGETLNALKGKVVLIDFWTYSCINCLRSSPYLNQWQEKYEDQGFTVIGLHTPEFAFEQNIENVQKAIDRNYGFTFPVGLDNDYATWDAFNNQFWPAKYLIDAEGNIRYTHFGEGA
jgi:cytochrome c biogenesis protein CcdA/thiol-disulfide isomerase/thioredoxin